MEDENSPRPFRRERNLSNRNFNKRGSRRRISTESHSSVDSLAVGNNSSASARMIASDKEKSESPIGESNAFDGGRDSSSTNSLQYSYSVNSDTENAFNFKSIRKMIPPTDEQVEREEEPQTPDPALMGVKQKVLRFETLQLEERKLSKSTKYMSKSLQFVTLPTLPTDDKLQLSPLRVLPVLPVRLKRQQQQQKQSNQEEPIRLQRVKVLSESVQTSRSIDDQRSEDDVDDISDYEETAEAQVPPGVMAAEYVVPEEAEELKEDLLMPISAEDGVNPNVPEIGLNDFGKVEIVSQKRASSVFALAGKSQTLAHSTSEDSSSASVNRDFPRNYRSGPRPKTEIIGVKNRHVIGKYNSFYQPTENESRTLRNAEEEGGEEEEEEEIELRNKGGKFVERILDELIATEETYVENLLTGINNYGNIFIRKDLPVGLRGKKYVLLGNIEQLVEFHRDEFLPMLHRNRRDLKRLFDEFQLFIDQNCFYGYVIFTMNKQRSLKLCDTFKNYFKLIQTELGDKLGINSFLVQPIQRMARYPLLLQQFISTLFKNRDFVMKPLIESVCRLEKKVRILLTTTNESEIINDIVDCNEFNVFYQGRFRKVSEFSVYDYSLKRSYRSKVFIFDKCIIYTEIKGKNLVFHGRYPCEHVGILAKTKSFTLFYERRRQQECDFHGDQVLIETWLELIRDMISSFITEERQKLQELYSRENDHLHRKPPSLSLFRDSNRFSSDSGIGNIWVLPKPDAEDAATAAANRTTWYTTA